NYDDESENNMDSFISLNLFSEIHSVFETEIKKINNFNNNKQSFLNDLFNNKFLTKEQKIEKITGKITALNNEFNKKINLLFTSANAGGTKKETKVIKESYKNTINNSYLDLQNELISELDKETVIQTTTNAIKNNSIIENGINYIDTSNLEELKKAISEVESKINLQKVKYSSSESSKESLDYYLYLNHVDKVSVENEISKNYFSICEEFIKKLELKEEVLQKLVDNFIVYVNDNCNQMIVNVSEKLEKAQKNIATDDDSLSNNNFFAQKSIEFFDNLKVSSNEVFRLLNEKFKNILKDTSLESLKTNAISFEYLSSLIKDTIKEINTKVFHVTDLSNRELSKIAELSENGLTDLKLSLI
ncbi:MAG: hypothetical protein K2H11_01075, partial [Malacoplasma sp.]|nr:hypothetical protein [Malacoplasma sp.]